MLLKKSHLVLKGSEDVCSYSHEIMTPVTSSEYTGPGLKTLVLYKKMKTNTQALIDILLNDLGNWESKREPCPYVKLLFVLVFLL